MPVVLSLVLLAVYLPVLRDGWVYDDANWLPGHIGTAWALAPYRWAAVIGAGEPWAVHALALGVHLVNGWLLWAIGRRWISRAGMRVALALFWLHPLQVESVAYVSGSLDALIACYVLLAVWLWRDSLLAKGGAIGLLGLALTVKWSALPVVGALLAVSGLRLRWPWVASGVGGSLLMIVRLHALTSLELLRQTGAHLAAHLLLTAGDVARGLAWVLWPMSLAVEHPPLTQTGALLGAGIWGALGILAWSTTATWRAWLWISVLLLARALSPDSRAITEHHWYLPAIALWLLAGYGVDTYSKGLSWYGRSASLQHC